VHQAEAAGLAGRDDRLRAGLLGLTDALCGHPVLEPLVGELQAPAHAAAGREGAVTRHFDQAQAGNRSQHAPGFLVDLAVASEVAGVVVGDPQRDLKAQPQPPLGDQPVEELRQVNDRQRPRWQARIVAVQALEAAGVSSPMRRSLLAQQGSSGPRIANSTPAS
jgi:hypothetical protein